MSRKLRIRLSFVLSLVKWHHRRDFYNEAIWFLKKNKGDLTDRSWTAWETQSLSVIDSTILPLGLCGPPCCRVLWRTSYLRSGPSARVMLWVSQPSMAGENSQASHVANCLLTSSSSSPLASQPSRQSKGIQAFPQSCSNALVEIFFFSPNWHGSGIGGGDYYFPQNVFL